MTCSTDCKSRISIIIIITIIIIIITTTASYVGVGCAKVFDDLIFVQYDSSDGE